MCKISLLGTVVRVTLVATDRLHNNIFDIHPEMLISATQNIPLFLNVHLFLSKSQQNFDAEL